MTHILAFKMFAELARYTERIDVRSQSGPDDIVDSLKLVEPSVEFYDGTMTITCRPRDPVHKDLLAEVATMISLYGIDEYGHRLPGSGVAFGYAHWGQYIFVDYPCEQNENGRISRVDVDIAP